MKIRHHNRIIRNQVNRMVVMQGRRKGNLKACQCCHPRRFPLCWKLGNKGNALNNAAMGEMIEKGY